MMNLYDPEVSRYLQACPAIKKENDHKRNKKIKELETLILNYCIDAEKKLDRIDIPKWTEKYYKEFCEILKREIKK